MPFEPPINYNALRAALVRSVRDCTGLGQNNVVMMEPEEPNANRPELPFAALKFVTTAVKSGWDTMNHAGQGGDQAGYFIYSGQRSIVCAFDFFGTTHEEAYGLAALYQGGLDQDLIWGALNQAGIAVWRVDQVVDLSALLSTGYEGRAHLTVQFGVTSTSLVDVGYIEHVPVAGVVEGETGDAAVSVAFTADLGEED